MEWLPKKEYWQSVKRSCENSIKRDPTSILRDDWDHDLKEANEKLIAEVDGRVSNNKEAR